MSEQNDFEYLMTLRIQTDNAIGQMHDVWSVIREMSSRDIEMDLKLNPKYDGALRDLKKIEARITEANDALKQTEKAAKDASDRVVAALSKIEGVSEAAGREIREAFDSDDIERAVKLADEFAKKMRGVNGEYARYYNTQSKRGDPADAMQGVRERAVEASGISAANLKSIRPALEKMEAAGIAWANAVGKEARDAADNAYLKAESEANDVAKSLGKEAQAIVQMLSSMTDLRNHTARIQRHIAEAVSKGTMNETQAFDAKLYAGLLGQAEVAIDSLTDRKGFDRLIERAKAAEPLVAKLVGAAMDDVITDLTSAIGQGTVQAIREANSDENREVRRVRDEAMVQFKDVHSQLFNVIADGALKTMGPTLSRLGPQFAAKFAGAAGMAPLLGAGGGGGGGGAGGLGGLGALLGGGLGPIDVRVIQVTPEVVSAFGARGNRADAPDLDGGKLNLDGMTGPLTSFGEILEKLAANIAVLKGLTNKNLKYTFTGDADELKNMRAWNKELERADLIPSYQNKDINYRTNLTSLMDDVKTLRRTFEALEDEAPVIRPRFVMPNVADLQQDYAKAVTAALQGVSDMVTLQTAIKADPEALRKSINQALDAMAPSLDHVQVRAHEAAFHASLKDALLSFATKDDAVTDIKAKVTWETPADGFKFLLNRGHLAAQIMDAFDEASKTLRMKGVRVSLGDEAAGDEKARATAKAKRAGKKAAGADVDDDAADFLNATFQDLWDKNKGRVIDRNKLGRNLTDAEKEYNTAAREFQRASRNQRKEAAKADPLETIRSVAGDAAFQEAQRFINAKNMKVDPTDPATADAKRSEAEWVRANWPRFFKDLTAAIKSAAENNQAGDASALSFAAMRFKTQYATPTMSWLDEQEQGASARNVTAARRAQEKAQKDAERKQQAIDAQQAYRDNHRTFDRSAFGDFNGTGLDRYADKLQAYERVIAMVRKYEQEMVGYTHARTGEEIEAANKRVTAATREMEIAKDVLNMRLLFRSPFQVSMQKADYAFEADDQGNISRKVSFQSEREMVGMGEAFRRTTSVLRETLMPSIEAINSAAMSHRGRLLRLARQAEVRAESTNDPVAADRNRARAERFSAQGQEIKMTSFESVLDILTKGPSGGAFDTLAATMRDTVALTAQEEGAVKRLRAAGASVAEVEAIREQAARRMLGSLTEQANIYNTKIRPAIQGAQAEVTLLNRYDQMKETREQDRFGLRRGVRGLTNAFGFYAGGMALGMGARTGVIQGMEYEQRLAEIQGTLSSKDAGDTEAIARGINQTANKYGVPITQAADAAKTLAQAGYDANKVMRELDYTMLGMRALGITIDQMNELKVAIQSVDESIDSGAIVEKLSRVESRYAVSASGLADAVKISAPFIKTFTDEMRGMTDFVDFTLGSVTVMVEKLRVSGQNAGQALKTIFARLLKPEVLDALNTKFGIKLANSDGALLPADQLLAQISTRYNELKDTKRDGYQGSDSIKADKLLATFAGSHRVNYAAALLEDYARAQRIAAESADAFGESQIRSDLAMDTFAARTQQVKNGFQGLVNNLMTGTDAATGFKVIMEQIANLLSGISGAGAGTGFLVSSLLAGTVAAKGTKSFYDRMAIRQDAKALNIDYTVLRDAVFSRRKERISDSRVRFGLDDAEANEIVQNARKLQEARKAQAAEQPGMLGRLFGRGAAATAGAGAAAATGTAARQVAQAGLASRAMGMVGTAVTGLASAIGPTSMVLIGLVGLTAVIGKLAQRANQAVKDADKFNVKLKSNEELKMWEAPQFEELRGDLKKIGKGDVYQGVEDIIAATRSQQVVDLLQKKYGIGPTAGGRPDFTTALARTTNAYGKGERIDQGVLSDDIVKTIIDSGALGKEATEYLNNMNTQGERFAFVTKLIGEAVWATTHRISDAITLLHDSVQRQVAATVEGVTRLDTSKRRGFMQQTMGWFSDLGQQTLQEENVFAGTSVGGKMAVRLGASSNMRSRMEEFLLDADVPTAIRERMMNQTGMFQQTMTDAMTDLVVNGKKIKFSLADLFAKAAEILDTDVEKRYTVKTPVFNAKEGRYEFQDMKTDRRGLITTQITSAMMAMANFEEQDILKLDPTFKPMKKPAGEASVSLFEDITSAAAKMADTWAQALLENGASAAIADRNLRGMLNATTATSLALVGGTEAITIFKDRFLDMVTSLYLESSRLASQERFAGRQGLAFNGAEARMGIAKSFYEQFDLFDEQARVDIVKKQSELQNLSFGKVKIRDDKGTETDANVLDVLNGNLPGATEATKELKKRRATLEAQITGYTTQLQQVLTGAFNFVEALPTDDTVGKNAGPRNDIISALKNEFAKTGGDITTVDIEQVKALLERYYEINRQITFEQNVQLQQSAQGVRWAEQRAGVSMMALETEISLTERTRLREAINRSVYDTQVADLALQRQKKTISADDYALKLRELEVTQEQSVEIERQRQLQEAIVTGRRQGMDNLRQTVGGGVRALFDMQKFGAIFTDRDDMDPDAASAERAEATKVYLGGILEAVFGTLATRFQENMILNLQEKLLQWGGLDEMFAEPEYMMKAAVIEAGSLVGSQWREAIYAPGMQVAAAIKAALTTPTAGPTPVIGGIGAAVAAAGATAGAAGTTAAGAVTGLTLQAAYNGTLNPRTKKPYQVSDAEAQALLAAAAKTGVDPSLLFAIAAQESDFDNRALNKTSSASGMMQLLPSTAGMSSDALRGDVGVSTMKGAEHLKWRLDRLQKRNPTWDQTKIENYALAGYSGNLDNIAKVGGDPANLSYIRAVRERQRLTAGAGGQRVQGLPAVRIDGNDPLAGYTLPGLSNLGATAGPQAGSDLAMVQEAIAAQLRNTKAAPMSKAGKQTFSNGQMAVMQAGAGVGSMLGVASAGGGTWSQAGGMVGSVVGTMAATRAGTWAGAKLGGSLGSAAGPIGTLAGAVAGAALSFGIAKLFGVMDKKPKTPKEIRHLENIEFNTRESISAIEQGVDKLRRPDASMFNLPTNFTVPSYMPQFAGGNGGGGGSVSSSGGDVDQSVTVTFSAGSIVVEGGGDTASVELAVERAVAKAINGGRRDTPRGRGNGR